MSKYVDPSTGKPPWYVEEKPPEKEKVEEQLREKARRAAAERRAARSSQERGLSTQRQGAAQARTQTTATSTAKRQTPTRDSPVEVAGPFIDALDRAERGAGGRAMQRVEGSLPSVYRERRRASAAEHMERYESFYQRFSQDLYTRRAGLLGEAARLKTSDPVTRFVKPPNVFVDAVGEVEREAGAEADRRIAESMTRARLEAQNVSAGVTFAAAHAVGAAAGFWEGATTPLRPYRYPMVIRDIADPETRAAIIRDIQTDPTKYLVGLPAAYVGGGVTGRAISRVAKRAGITKPQATGEFVEVVETRGTDPGAWRASKRLPTGRGSKAKSWGPPGEGGFLDTVLVPKQITRTVFVPKVTWPTWETPFGLAGAAAFLTQLEKVVPTVPPSPPLTAMDSRRGQTQRRRTETRTRTGTVALPRYVPYVEPVKQRDRQGLGLTPRQPQLQKQAQAQAEALTMVPKAVTRLLRQTATPVYRPFLAGEKKKRKKSGRRAAAERRLDPLKWTFPDVKMPEATVPKMEDIKFKIEVPEI